MSSTFTIHLPRDAVPGDPAAIEKAEFVRDGFGWGAFLVPGLWFLWHRHLGLSILAFAIVLGSGLGLGLLRIPGPAIGLIQLIIHLAFGLEGSSLRRFAYRLRGRPTTGVVIAADEAEAEVKAFSRWLEPDAPLVTPGAEAPLAPALKPAPALRPRDEPVFGLFPDFEGRR